MKRKRKRQRPSKSSKRQRKEPLRRLPPLVAPKGTRLHMGEWPNLPERLDELE